MGKSNMKRIFQEVLSHLKNPNLLPFYLATLLYLVVYTPHIQRPQELLSVAILKTLPIWILTFNVYLRSRRLKTSGGNNSGNETANGTDVNLTLFLSGLLLSSVGDICLVYHTRFTLGLFAFAVAQFCYLLSMRQLFKRSFFAWMALPLSIFLLLFMVSSIQDNFMLTIVLIYLALIHTMFFMAIASFESNPSASTLCIMAGAAIFIASDTAIAFNRWVVKIGCVEGLVLFTYYTAQLLLSVGMTNARIPWRVKEH